MASDLATLVTEVQQKVTEQARVLQLAYVQQHLQILKKHEEQQSEIGRLFEVLLAATGGSADVQASARRLRAEPGTRLIEDPLAASGTRPSEPHGLEHIGQQLQRLQNLMSQKLSQLSQEVIRERIARAREQSGQASSSARSGGPRTPSDGRLPKSWAVAEQAAAARSRGGDDEEEDGEDGDEEGGAEPPPSAQQMVPPPRRDPKVARSSAVSAVASTPPSQPKPRRGDDDRNGGKDKGDDARRSSKARKDSSGEEAGMGSVRSRGSLSAREQECMTPLEHMRRVFGRA